MGRFQWIGPAVAVMVAWLAASSPASARAQATSSGSKQDDLRREVADLGLKLLDAQAQVAEIKEEQRLLDEKPLQGSDAEAKPMAASKGFWTSALIPQAFKEGAEAPSLKVQETMDAVQKTIDEDRKKAFEAWKAAKQRELAFLAQAAETQELMGGASGVRALAGAFSPHLLLLGLLAVLGGLFLTAHEIRDRLRWRLRALGSRPSLIALALAVPLAAALGASPGTTDKPDSAPKDNGLGESPAWPRIDLEKEREELQKKIQDTNDEIQAARRQLDDRMEEFRRARAAHGLKPVEPSETQAVERIGSLERQVQDQFRTVRTAARLTAKAASEALGLEKKLQSDEGALQAFVVSSRGSATTAGLLRLAACVGFILAAALPMNLVRSRRRRELKEQSEICPRCLNKGTLDYVDAATDAIEGLQARFRLKVCLCDYEIRENYILQNRLCFPTVGVKASGKTHWMMMLYDTIKNANIPVASAIRKIPSREDARFDELVRRLLYEGGSLDPTTLNLPYPLTFHVHDADPLGPNKTMVNLFDFSGEMRNFTIDQSEFRSRALLCEGFTLFLDPIQVSPTRLTKVGEVTIEEQIQTLAQFAEEMHAIRGLAAENPIDMPIAVCVSKMDLIVAGNVMGTQAIPLVNELRATMTEKVDLSLIHQRSQLCARAIPMMFPGWNVERTLRENFGGRYMFFPMSAVGLEGAELGVEDLSRRTIAPFGMIEPLLWLLHMHGYCVLH